MRLALALLLAATSAGAQDMARIDCATEGGDTFAIVLSAPSRLGPPMHCVSLARFTELTPCAPDGGWGLSGADGQLATLETEALGLAHEGGWFFARLGPSQFVASASVGTRPPLTLEVEGETFWRMTLDLAARTGSMFDEGGETRFACR